MVMLICWILYKHTTMQFPIFHGVDTNWRCHITLHKLSMDIRGICINIALQNRNSFHCFHEEDGSKALTEFTVSTCIANPVEQYFEMKLGYSRMVGQCITCHLLAVSYHLAPFMYQYYLGHDGNYLTEFIVATLPVESSWTCQRGSLGQPHCNKCFLTEL